MMRRRRPAARAWCGGRGGWLLALVVGMAGGGAWRSAAAQAIAITFAPIQHDSISPAPVISVSADQVPADVAPATMTIEASFEPEFRTPFFAQSAQGMLAQFHLDSLLPKQTRVYFRARLIDHNGLIRAQVVDTTRVQSWLTLLRPNGNLDVLFTREPEFDWNSPGITLPPGPWTYQLLIINRADPRDTRSYGFQSTSGVPRTPLNACTSYRWGVTATATNGGSAVDTVFAPGTFVIQTPDCPLATILYPNFPNPFGRGERSSSTCFWFDLAHHSTVKLTIYDLRLRLVKHLIPGDLPAQLDSGVYGRQLITQVGTSGCDPRTSWDGRDDMGHSVPPGIYIAVFEADGVRSTDKIYYKGP